MNNRTEQIEQSGTETNKNLTTDEQLKTGNEYEITLIY
jgi:hypothetical protein